MFNFLTRSRPSSDLDLNPFPKDSPEFQKLSPLLKYRLGYFQETLEAAAETGLLTRQHIKGRVVDFGVSRGISTALLGRSGADVTGIEIFPPDIAEAKELELLPSERLVAVDGINYLENVPAGSLDLITGFMFGPDSTGALSKDLMRVSEHALKSSGVLLLSSDILTIHNILQANRFSEFKMAGRTIFIARKRSSEDPFLHCLPSR